LGFQALTLLRGDPQLRQMFVANADAFAALRQRVLREPVLALIGFRRTSQSTVTPDRSSSFK
jgi:hypothetical protein